MMAAVIVIIVAIALSFQGNDPRDGEFFGSPVDLLKKAAEDFDYQYHVDRTAADALGKSFVRLHRASPAVSGMSLQSRLLEIAKLMPKQCRITIRDGGIILACAKGGE
jgi:hypothetical protein